MHIRLYLGSLFINIMLIATDEFDSEPETEIWEDSEEAPEEFTGFTATDTIPNTSHALSRWILRFLMVMQASFRLSDVVLARLLLFFIAIFRILGQTCTTARNIAQCLPQSLYKAKQVLGEVSFQRYVVCRKCYSIYTFEESLESSGSIEQSKRCSFRRFPAHPYASMRSPCGTLLLKSVKLATKKNFFLPLFDILLPWVGCLFTVIVQ